MASSSAGQALRLVIAWMWSMGWSGSYMEWIEGGQPALAERLAHPDVGLGEAGADVGQLAGHDDGEAARPGRACGRRLPRRAARAMAWASAASSRV